MVIQDTVKQFARLVYWKACFPTNVSIMHGELRIVDGPFRGMLYASKACASAHSAKLLGTYERELLPALTEICHQNFDIVVHIGAAEGYYAIGLAKLTGVRTVAFETQALAREMLIGIAKKNNVSIDVRGECNPSALALVLSNASKTLIICDVEGYKRELLDPSLVPELLHCHMIVEPHDQCGQLVQGRFTASHTIREFVSEGRGWQDFPSKNIAARLLPRAVALRAMNEGRDNGQRWFWMVPKVR